MSDNARITRLATIGELYLAHRANLDALNTTERNGAYLAARDCRKAVAKSEAELGRLCSLAEAEKVQTSPATQEGQ
jgi:hypothetical protein